MSEKKSFKVSSSIEAYSYFVLNGLIEYKGISVSDVISHIIRDWCKEHKDELVDYELTVEDYKKARDK